MPALSITPPFPVFTDKNGTPLEDGYVYIGVANLEPVTNPINVYWDNILTTSAVQPIRTLAGYPSYYGTPSRIYTGEIAYSIKVFDKNGNIVFSSPFNTGPDVLVDFAVSEEVQVATAGQTVFNLANSYSPGTNSLTVYVDGVNQYDGSSYSYQETNGTTVTFNQGLHVGALVKFTTAIQLSGGATDAAQVSYYPAGAGAVVTNVQDKLRQTVSVKDFGAVGDGVADDTAAIQAAIDASYGNYNKTVHVPNGIYKLTGTITITQGVMIMCEGSQGSNEAYGTVFKHYSNNSCFRWDGSGAQYTGTGGGLQNCLIVKANTYSGGNAIEVVNQSDTNRCGEMVFHNILAYGLSSGRWTRGFVFDGTATNISGARGVRTVHMTKCRAADVTTAGETILLNQVTHFYAHGLAADTGSGAAAGITMKGINDGVYLTALGLAGTFTIIANDASNFTNNLTIDGKIGGSFTNNDPGVYGTVCISGQAGVVNKSKTLNMVLGKKPGAMITLASNLSDVTGDGTKYQIAFNTTQFDPYGNWQGNTFNVTVAGRYKVTLCVGLYDVDAAHTRCDLEIARTGISPSAEWDIANNPYAMSAPSGGSRFCSLTLETTMECAYGDIIAPYITVSNGAKVVDIYGAATSYSYIAVEYLG